MKRTVLPYDDTAVYAYHLPVGESLLDDSTGFLVVLRLIVCGIYHCIVYDDEVGVGGRQTFAVETHGVWHRQSQQTVWFPVGGLEGLQLFLHHVKTSVLLVGRVVAAHVYERVVGGSPYERVDVSVGIVSDKLSVVNPHNTVGMNIILQFQFNLFLRKRLVAVGGKQTA